MLRINVWPVSDRLFGARGKGPARPTQRPALGGRRVLVWLKEMPMLITTLAGPAHQAWMHTEQECRSLFWKTNE
jgi:hypothetical protein